MRAPGSRFSASVGKVVAMRLLVPAISRGVMVSRCPAGADLGTLQIPQDTDRFPFFGGDLTHHFDQLELFRLGAVGEVKPSHIEAGADQLAEDRFMVTGGAKGSDNLGPAGLLRGKGITRFHQGKAHSSPILRSRRGSSGIVTGCRRGNASSGKLAPIKPHRAEATVIVKPLLRISSMLNSTRTRAAEV
jgi:hypothetical protein